MAGNPELFFIDTIGFALDLDPELISAFQLNLDDMRGADIILLVVDSSDPIQLLDMKMQSSLQILRETGIDEARILVVLNKEDLSDQGQVKEVRTFIDETFSLPSVLVSAKTESHLDELRVRIRQLFEEVGPLTPNDWKTNL